MMAGSLPCIVACVGAVVLRDARALFVRQTYGSLKGQWSIPWGYVQGDDAGDPPDVAALRETREESGVTAQVEGLLGIQNHTTQAGEPRVYFLFLCRHVSGEPTPDGYETDRAAYFSLEELDALEEPIDPFCAWLARRVLMGEHHIIPPEPLNPYRPHRAYL
ncbi:MAG: hypothetical protein Kow00120_09020 [Anaerolineae bacterium]